MVWHGVVLCKLHFVSITCGALLVLSSVRSSSCLVFMWERKAFVLREQRCFGSGEEHVAPLGPWQARGIIKWARQVLGDCPIFSLGRPQRFRVWTKVALGCFEG